MSKYGGSVSFAQACNYDKEEIKAAFEGMIRTGETGERLYLRESRHSAGEAHQASLERL